MHIGYSNLLSRYPFKIFSEGVRAFPASTALGEFAERKTVGSEWRIFKCPLNSPKAAQHRVPDHRAILAAKQSRAERFHVKRGAN